MRELVAYCDLCHLEGERVPVAHVYTMGIVSGENRPALKVLELCEMHEKIATELLAMLASIGQPPDLKPGKAPKAVGLGRPPVDGPRDTYGRLVADCPVCGRTITRSTMVSHIWSAHRTDPKPEAPTVCPDCRASGLSTQAMSQHRRFEHGYDAVADALSGVRP